MDTNNTNNTSSVQTAIQNGDIEITYVEGNKNGRLPIVEIKIHKQACKMLRLNQPRRMGRPPRGYNKLSYRNERYSTHIIFEVETKPSDTQHSDLLEAAAKFYEHKTRYDNHSYA